ncbi:hypothetical protein J3454_00645 [Erythrobacter sp. NFXS35]
MVSAQHMPEQSTAPGTAMQQTPPMTRSNPQQPMQQRRAAPPMSRPMTEQGTSLTNAEQQSLMAAWPAEKQASFKQWPAATQDYFWSLTPERQSMFWALADSDKVKLSNMPEQQRESIWAQIEAQMDPSRS